MQQLTKSVFNRGACCSSEFTRLVQTTDLSPMVKGDFINVRMKINIDIKALEEDAVNIRRHGTEMNLNRAGLLCEIIGEPGK